MIGNKIITRKIRYLLNMFNNIEEKRYVYKK